MLTFLIKNPHLAKNIFIILVAGYRVAINKENETPPASSISRRGRVHACPDLQSSY